MDETDEASDIAQSPYSIRLRHQSEMERQAPLCHPVLNRTGLI